MKGKTLGRGWAVNNLSVQLQFSIVISSDFRYQNELPKKIKSRGKDAHLIHEELVQLMKWKQTVSRVELLIDKSVEIQTVVGFLTLYYICLYFALYRQSHSLDFDYKILVGNEIYHEFYVYSCSLSLTGLSKNGLQLETHVLSKNIHFRSLADFTRALHISWHLTTINLSEIQQPSNNHHPGSAQGLALHSPITVLPHNPLPQPSPSTTLYPPSCSPSQPPKPSNNHHPGSTQGLTFLLH